MHIGNQSRPKIFDLKINRHEVIYKKVYEIDERVRMARFVHEDDLKDNEHKIVKGSTNEDVFIEKEIDKEKIKEILCMIQKEGIKSIAVVFMHSYTYNHHEEMVKVIATEMGCFSNITISSDTIAMKKYVPRGHTVKLIITTNINYILNDSYLC